MSRARNLKPGFFRNEELANLSPLTRIFFQGLWCEADRRGIVEDRPKRLKADILPYDKANVEDMLKNLESSGFIRRYEVDGVRCIHVVNFAVHQNPHRDEKSSTLPAPCEHSVDTVPAPDENGSDRALTLNTDSLSLDSLNTDSSVTPPTPSRGKRKTPLTDLPEDFTVTDGMRDWAKRRHGLSDAEIDARTEHFLNYVEKTGKQYAKWDAAWRDAMGWEIRGAVKTPTPIRPPLPPGFTQSRMDEYVTLRRQRSYIPPDAVAVVDAYIAAMDGRAA